MLTSIFTTGKLSRLMLVLAGSLLVSACDLKVVATTGGTVTSNPAMINCRADGGTCLVRNYEDMRKKFGISRAQLIATPDAGYRLSHWSGCDSTERLNCWVDLDSDIEVKAVFKPLDYATDGDPTVRLRNRRPRARAGCQCNGLCVQPEGRLRVRHWTGRQHL